METTTRTPAWIGACARALDARGAGRQLAILTRALAMPVLGIAIFLLLWQAGAARVQTTLGQLPGPALVWSEAKGLHREYLLDREKEAAFHERQQALPRGRVASTAGLGHAPDRFDQLEHGLALLLDDRLAQQVAEQVDLLAQIVTGFRHSGSASGPPGQVFSRGASSRQARRLK